jgi:hypothetical protein
MQSASGVRSSNLLFPPVVVRLFAGADFPNAQHVSTKRPQKKTRRSRPGQMGASQGGGSKALVRHGAWRSFIANLMPKPFRGAKGRTRGAILLTYPALYLRARRVRLIRIQRWNSHSDHRGLTWIAEPF